VIQINRETGLSRFAAGESRQLAANIKLNTVTFLIMQKFDVDAIKMNQPAKGKLEPRDERLALILKWVPWLSFLLVSVVSPLPILFLYLRSGSTESAAIFLLLSLASLGAGILIGALFLILFLIYRRSWHRRLRDRLASDGITASEVTWFTSELTSEERQNLSEIQKTNPLLADAYAETLASRLTATRIVARSKHELLRVDRRINSARRIIGADTASLVAA